MTNLDPTASSFAGSGSAPPMRREPRAMALLRRRPDEGSETRLPPMPVSKRLFDLTIALLLVTLLMPLLLVLSLVLLLAEGRPIFYVG